MKRIIGAVGVGDKTFTAGQEAAFEKAANAAGVNFARLESKGVISGFVGTVEAETAPVAEAPKAKAKKTTKRGR